MKLTIYSSDVCGEASNVYYPKRIVATDVSSFKQAVSFDHVAAEYKDNYRSNVNFQKADHISMDCDNEKSDDPETWISPEDVLRLFSGVSLATATSRNHMKEKGKKSARPRFHVYFPIPETEDAESYSELKGELAELFPFFDAGALGSARFMFGNPNTEVTWSEGQELITDFIRDDFSKWDDAQEEIPEGTRNKTLSHYAGRVIIRLGATEEAYEMFLKKAGLCNPPLPNSELQTIWHSAKRFGNKVSKQEGYIPPDEYDMRFRFRPPDYSDIGQAKALVSRFGGELKYCSATDFLRYNGVCWVESKQQAVGAMEEFLDLQLLEAKEELELSTKALIDSGVSESVIRQGGRTLEKAIGLEQKWLYRAYKTALTYYSFVMKRRDMKYVTSALQAAKPMLDTNYDELDASPFLLNCPDGTYELEYGLKGKREHKASDLITKVTATAPGDAGKELWLDSLEKTFQGDSELVEYVQMIAGLSAIGQVQLEALIISYGEGSNGKSTFWNAISGVLGNYSGTISADALTANVRRNVKPELAEAKGKRLLIASELEEGMRLSTSIVKQLCSTDRIKGEKKYKDPADFVPSHTLVLYTNHLPKVGAMDSGIWRRLIVIPFLAKIEGSNDIKNYGKYLLDHASPYVLKWIIEGAKKAIDSGFKFPMPTCVKDAITKYRSDNDWLTHFLEDCCDVEPRLYEQSGKLYENYRAYCARTGDFTRSSIEFTAALEQQGFKRVRKRDGRYILGLKLKLEDFI